MYMTKDRSNLNSAGNSKMNLYYTKEEIDVSQVELDHYTGKYEYALPSLAFGSTSQILIPNQDFLYQVFLYVKFPALAANVYLGEGWLLSLIKEITFTLGSSNVSNVRISGKSLLHANLMQVCNETDRKEILRLAGEPSDSTTVTNIDGVILLHFPFSTLVQKKGFDCSLLSSPIQISITFNPANSIFMGPPAGYPTQMERANVFLRQGVLTDKGQSIRNDLISNPSMIYSYPFIHQQSPSVKYITGNNFTGGNIYSNEITVQIEEFLWSDLVNIVVSCHYTNNQVSSHDEVTSANSRATNPLHGLEMIDMELLYNGQTIYKCPGASSRLINMLNHNGSTYTPLTIRQDGTNAYTTQSDYLYMYQFALGDMKSIVFEGGFDNTSRYSSQSMLFKFKVKKINIGDADNTPIELHWSYFYNSIAQISNQTSTIVYG